MRCLRRDSPVRDVSICLSIPGTPDPWECYKMPDVQESRHYFPQPVPLSLDDATRLQHGPRKVSLISALDFDKPVLPFPNSVPVQFVENYHWQQSSRRLPSDRHA